MTANWRDLDGHTKTMSEQSPSDMIGLLVDSNLLSP